MMNVSSNFFGSILTAMVTPFKAAGEVDFEAVANLAKSLVEEGNDGIVVSGTTGESSTLSDSEKILLFKTVVEAVGEKVFVLAGVGSNNTESCVNLAKAAQKVGVDGLMLVTPYYSKPSQAGIQKHFETVAAATPLPIMLYDIPARSGVSLEFETICRLSENPNIVAIKDSSADFVKAIRVMSKTKLLYYCGDDGLVLPWLAIGASGLVGVSTHVAASRYKALVESVRLGKLGLSQELNKSLEPVQRAVMSHVPAAVAVKQVLVWQGKISNQMVRLPLVLANETEQNFIRNDLKDVGIDI